MTTSGNSTVCIWTCQKHSKAVSAGIITSAILLKPISQFILKTLSDSFQTHTFGWVGSIVFLHYLILYHLSRLWKEWCWWQNSRSTWHLDRACPVSLTAAITSNEWDVRAVDRYLLQFYLDHSWNREVSWYHLNQISNPTVCTIKVTGLENLYRKDDKYVSKGNVLFNLRYILISVDCCSTRLSEKSSCHPTMIGIVRLLSIDSWMSMKETLWVYGCMG